MRTRILKSLKREKHCKINRTQNVLVGVLVIVVEIDLEEYVRLRNRERARSQARCTGNPEGKRIQVLSQSQKAI